MDISYKYDERLQVWVPDEWHHFISLKDREIVISPHANVPDYKLNTEYDMQ